jgi:hypothetical protein
MCKRFVRNCVLVLQEWGGNYSNRQFPLQTNFKTRQGDANKSPQLERAYNAKMSKISKFGREMS